MEAYLATVSLDLRSATTSIWAAPLLEVGRLGVFDPNAWVDEVNSQGE
jgi:hypothetical protein